MKPEKVFAMSFAGVYPLEVRTGSGSDRVLYWSNQGSRYETNGSNPTQVVFIRCYGAGLHGKNLQSRRF